jgi:hypothetical protein
VSHAIQSGGFSPSRYYMINAAVPIEAYDMGSVVSGQSDKMTHFVWKDPPLSNGSGRLFSANWHKLFVGSADHRRELRWSARFADVLPVAHGFYSQGDEVVADATSSNPSILIMIMRQGFAFSRGAWAAQELSKGTLSIASLFFSRVQAGWGESGYSIGQPEDANPSDESLRVRPFFYSFYDTPNDLTNPDAAIASAKASSSNVQYDLLARGIPSMSFAAAVHPLNPLGTVRNFDMQQLGRSGNQWPTEGHAGGNAGQWLHSDFKEVALPYVYRMYQAMIDRGSLQ